MEGSSQKWVGRNRPPRVQITYDVETGGAIEKKELPLVVGILADLAGKPEKAMPPIRDRKFVEIDRDNFNDVMASLKPRLEFSVASKLPGKDGNIPKDGTIQVVLQFKNIADLRPEAIVNQVEPLRMLFEARQKLNDLISKIDGNENLDNLLHEVAGATEEERKKITIAAVEARKLLEAAKKETPNG